VIERIFDDSPAPLERAVSVIIPAFNEGPHLAQQIREVDAVMRTTGWTYEIIVVDDGSADNTAAEADSTGVTVLQRVAYCD